MSQVPYARHFMHEQSPKMEGQTLAATSRGELDLSAHISGYVLSYPVQERCSWIVEDFIAVPRRSRL